MAKQYQVHSLDICLSGSKQQQQQQQLQPPPSPWSPGGNCHSCSVPASFSPGIVQSSPCHQSSGIPHLQYQTPPESAAWGIGKPCFWSKSAKLTTLTLTHSHSHSITFAFANSQYAPARLHVFVYPSIRICQHSMHLTRHTHSHTHSLFRFQCIA